jgi:hypothetical protein
MSGWGCRYQLDDQCLLLRKECKPGFPGCVLYKKVHFIGEAERFQPRTARKAIPKRRSQTEAASSKKR